MYQNRGSDRDDSLPVDEPLQPAGPPIVDGVPKLLFTEEEVSLMCGFSVSTVRNRYNPTSKWFDPNFPRPRTTDGSGEGRKAAVRWHWRDLYRYTDGLPLVPRLSKAGRSIRSLADTGIRDAIQRPFRI